MHVAFHYGIKMLENLEEEEFWSLLSGRRRLEAIGLIDSKTKKVDY